MAGAGSFSERRLELDYWVSEFEYIENLKALKIVSYSMGLGDGGYDNLKVMLAAELGEFNAGDLIDIRDLSSCNDYALGNEELVKHMIRLIEKIQEGEDLPYLNDPEDNKNSKLILRGPTRRVKLSGNSISFSW